MTNEEATAFAEAWIADWNRHDLEAILAHYADPPAHTSPLVVTRLSPDRADGTIRDTSELRAYFARGLESAPPLRFTLLAAFAGAGSVALVYLNHRDATVVEVMHLDERSKVTRSVVHYRPSAEVSFFAKSSERSK